MLLETLGRKKHRSRAGEREWERERRCCVAAGLLFLAARRCAPEKIEWFTRIDSSSGERAAVNSGVKNQMNHQSGAHAHTYIYTYISQLDSLLFICELPTVSKENATSFCGGEKNSHAHSRVLNYKWWCARTSARLWIGIEFRRRFQLSQSVSKVIALREKGCIWSLFYRWHFLKAKHRAVINLYKSVG